MIFDLDVVQWVFAPHPDNGYFHHFATEFIGNIIEPVTEPLNSLEFATQFNHTD
jgi:hypothetical protein